jgi:proton-dependent oligopeptide transporter, POT family
MPPQVRYIVGNEACERFSYYGMVSILTLYCVNALKLGEARGEAISHYFKFGVYFMPLLGAWLSDRVLGRYRTILYISLFYCLGHGVLALTDLTPSIDSKLVLLYVGLTLLAFGGGGIKPCVSAFVGDQFLPSQSHLLRIAYGLFYWSINFGSFFAFLWIPHIAKKAGYGWAFGVPGIAMALATLVFWLGRKRYRHVAAEPGNPGGYWEMLRHAVGHASTRRPGQGFWDACRNRYSAEQIEDARQVTRVIRVLLLCPFFWALYDQSNSTWVVQASHMTPWPVPEWLQPFVGWMVGNEIGAEQMQSMNALLVMVTIPFFNSWLFPLIERSGVRVTTLGRMSAGMFVTAASFVAAAALQYEIDQGVALSVLWQTVPYVILTAGEVLVSSTGNEFAFREAPVTMRSTSMSFWLLSIAMGNLFVAQLLRLNAHTGPDGKEALYVSGLNQFLLYAGLLFVVAFAFVAMVRRYRYREEQAAPDALQHA